MKIARLLAVAIVVVAVVADHIPNAAADTTCDTDDVHCYGAVTSTDSLIGGVRVTINPSCLHSPSNEFVTDETWLFELDSNVWWVEVGFIGYGGGLPWAPAGTEAGRYLFWADDRPKKLDSSGGFNAHFFAQTPSFATTHVSIGKSPDFTGVYNIEADQGTNTWVMESERNYMDPNTGKWGSESTSNSSNSDAEFSGVGYKKQGNWYNGLPASGTISADHNQIFDWTDKPNSFEAGMPC